MDTIDAINESWLGGALVIAVFVFVIIFLVLVFTPRKCKKHGVELSEDWNFEEGMGSYDGSASCSHYCHLCRAESKA